MRTRHSLPKHQVIFKQLEAGIVAGKYEPGMRLPSEAQLVKQFNVSRPTAARALRDLQHAGLVQRRAGSGSYVSMNAGSESRLRLLGLLIPGLGTTEIFESICGEIAGMARAHDFSVLWGGSSHPLQDLNATREHAEELCHQFIERKVSGVFFAPFELIPQAEEVNHRLAGLLRQAGVAVVLLDRDLSPFPQRSDFDLIEVDNFVAGYLLAEHLVKLGCRRIQFVVRPLSAPTVDARISGAREAMIRHGIEISDFVKAGDPSDTKFARLLTTVNRPDAFICGNDNTAAVLMHSLDAVGLRVPRDIRVVGFDDVKYATLLRVPLTTIHQPCGAIGAMAFRMMLERIANPASPPHAITLAPQLIVRESCGAYLPRG